MTSPQPTSRPPDASREQLRQMLADILRCYLGTITITDLAAEATHRLGRTPGPSELATMAGLVDTATLTVSWKE